MFKRFDLSVHYGCFQTLVLDVLGYSKSFKNHFNNVGLIVKVDQHEGFCFKTKILPFFTLFRETMLIFFSYCKFFFYFMAYTHNTSITYADGFCRTGASLKLLLQWHPQEVWFVFSFHFSFSTSFFARCLVSKKFDQN